MLNRLKITNFLLIDTLELNFKNGLTVITGETGSGKSIIIDALMILFGAKTNIEIIRHNTDAANFEAEFIISHQDTKQWLYYNDLQDADNPDNIICRRIINKNGKNKIYINGYMATISQIKQLGDLILDIHTQHSSITLIKPEIQRQLLDEYAGISNEVNLLYNLYKQIHQLENKLALSKTNMHELQLKKLYLTEAISDINHLNLKTNEWQNLEQQQKQLTNLKYILNETNQINNLLNDKDYSIFYNIQKINNSINKLEEYLPQAKDLKKFLNSAHAELEEFAYLLNNILKNIDADDIVLQDIEIRMNEIFDISRKYKTTPQALLEFYTTSTNQLGEINLNQNTEFLEQELEKIKQEYYQLAKYITEHRVNAAKSLSEKITHKLHELAINGNFVIVINELNHLELSAHGLESIEYQVSFNNGMPLQKLSKVASGGELSRTALALYLTLSIHNPPEIIIFDEIDVGIGGKIAAQVGEMLSSLSTIKQIICITHQAQCASFADTHLLVKKTTSTNSTVSAINELTEEQRVTEIARMIGGLKISKTTLEHAKELLLNKVN